MRDKIYDATCSITAGRLSGVKAPMLTMREPPRGPPPARDLDD